MTDNYDNGGNSDGNVTAVGIRTGHHQWPASSADIVEYDSSVAADTPTLQQQHTQFLLPQQQRQRIDQFPQNSGAGAVNNNSNASYAGKSAVVSARAENSTTRVGSKSTSRWKTRALYTFLACLLLVVVVNLTLTLWFLRVTQFTSVMFSTVIYKFIFILFYYQNYICWRWVEWQFVGLALTGSKSRIYFLVNILLCK